jgi:hypothetical protein
VPRRLTGNCAKHQREISTAVNRARMIAADAVRGDGELAMQVILRDDMDNLGKSGEVVNVKPGYARNYLLPRGLAIKATAGDITRVEHEKRVIAARTAKLAKERRPRPTAVEGARVRSSARSVKRTSCTAPSPAATSPRRCARRASPSTRRRSISTSR